MPSSFLSHSQQRSGTEWLHLAWDVFIIVLVGINLTLLLFDSLFIIPPLNEAFEAMAPRLYQAYQQNIHANFYEIDLVFVSIFIFDVLLGWAAAIIERRYHRWFFYPFVHWYDVLGCIPLAGFRLLRALRILGLLLRLQKMNLIDMRGWWIYHFLYKYYDILLEELSDRIAVRLLGNVQQQIQKDNSLSQRMIEQVIMPRREELIREIAQRIETMVDGAYRNRRGDLMRYISALIGRALEDSPEIQRLRRLPMGEQLSRVLDDTLSDIVCRLVNEAIMGMRSPEFSNLVEGVTSNAMDTLLEVDERSSRITEQALVDILEILKTEISRQQWKEKYA
ncbi:ion transporter [Pistricoccus aurantiacus]|uniref:ion transporter n=1 Tax=Pistricoccus aurantiacus TaxID=1883414 RepID=UPI00363A16F1